jgi:4-hydroxy-tetrahydrodipicolinate reductase
MGLALVRAVHETAGARVVAAIERPGSEAIGKDIGELAGLGPSGVKVSDDPLAAFAKADGVLDFTVPTASVEFAGYAAQARIVHVLGTTGFSADDNARIEAAARHATIVKSGNMSLGVNLLAVLVEQAARAPSGTALLLGEAAAAGRGIPLSGNDVRVRDGHTGPRDTGSIGFASLRGGSVPGDHSVILAGNGETITLSHHAQDRAIFARGAVKAALWARGRKPGLYSMRDVLGL